MYLKSLKISSFRNYTREEVSFCSRVNCIQGANGSGKSNLLEAIHLISTGKSFRTHRLQELIQYQNTGFQIEVEFIKETISNTLKISFSPEGRKIVHNQTAHSSFLPLLGLLPSIILSPEDICILTGAPAERRRFLDLHLAQIDPNYVYHLGRYQRALKQRNILLKRQEEQGLSTWEELMAISASYLIEKRLETIFELQKPCQKYVGELSKHKEPFSMEYESSLILPEDSTIPLSTVFAKQWEKMRKKELDAKTTLIGPHRDDILFFLQKKDVKTYCSEGQKRCCLAALRLAEWERLKNRSNIPPLFGIDDFGVHLDEERSSLLKNCLKEMGQVFLTAPSFINDTPSNMLLAENGSIKTYTKIDVENTLILKETL